jgi:alpha-tubulin suppressor-like RCC1 family protein
MRAAAFLSTVPSLCVMTLFACGGEDTAGPTTENGAPTVASVQVTPISDTLVSLGETVQLTAAARDASGNMISGRAFTWSSSNVSVATVSASGLVTAVADGAATISAAADGKSGTATISVDQVAAELTFSIQPTETQVTETMAPAVEVVIRDANGHAVVNATERVTLVIENNPGEGELSGTTTVVPVDGVARFGDLVIDKLGNGYTFTATSGAVAAASSAPFDIVFAFATVNTGASHTCGLSTSGTAYCWGDNTVGQLGDASDISSTRPVRVAGGLRFAQLTGGGGNHTCALTDDGEAYCWGDNPFGQLGDGTTTSSSVPVRAASSLSLTTIDAGPYHTCGLTATGAAYCWGANGPENQSFGDREGLGYALGAATTELCDNPNPNYRGAQWPCSPTPLAVAGGMSFRSTSAGLWASCGVAMTGGAYCWGVNGFDNLGTGTEDYATGPTQVAGGLLFEEAVHGAIHGCGLVNNNAYCWGALIFTWGQLGTGTFDPSSTPTPVAGGLSFSTVVPSDANNIYESTCGLTTEGEAFCWGTNRWGGLGTDVPISPTCNGSDFPCSNIPVPVAGGITFISISTNAEYSCGVAESRDLYCWGVNDEGQLGDGTTNDAATPVQVVVP